jgi:prophage regulatory protein
MPVSDAVQERFIRLPEVMHLCGLSRSTIYDLISREAFPKQISLGGKNSLKSPHGWRIVLPNATGAMTHDDDRSAQPLFLACFFSPFPGIVFPLSQNRQPGLASRVTYWRHQTRLASFFVSMLRHTFFRAVVSLYTPWFQQ